MLSAGLQCEYHYVTVRHCLVLSTHLCVYVGENNLKFLMLCHTTVKLHGNIYHNELQHLIEVTAGEHFCS